VECRRPSPFRFDFLSDLNGKVIGLVDYFRYTFDIVIADIVSDIVTVHYALNYGFEGLGRQRWGCWDKLIAALLVGEFLQQLG
jgi:hypothetical protein